MATVTVEPIGAGSIARVRPEWSIRCRTHGSAVRQTRVMVENVTEAELLVAIEEARLVGPPPPSTISMRQCRLQLLSEGLLAMIDAEIATMGDAAQIEWEYAQEVKRDHPLVQAMQALLDRTAQEMDTFFIEAAKL